MASRKYKILVLGADGFNANNEHTKIVSCPWEKLAQAPNPRDYDIVVVSCFVKDPEEIDWEPLPTLLNREAIRDILFHGGEIIIVGDPRFDIKLAGKYSESAFLEWTNLTFSWHGGGGDTVNIRESKENGKYFHYLQLIKKWEFSLKYCELVSNALYNDPDVYDLAKVNALASNRYNHLLAFEVILTQMKKVYISGYTSPRQVAVGKFVFLPSISVSFEETIHLVLRDLCGFTTAVPEPAWAQNLVAPGQEEIDHRISEARDKIAAINAELTSLVDLREEKRACLKLLYERELILEPIVWSALRSLGAQVEEPTEKNKEDGWIAVTVGGETYEGVLEIKSTKNDHLGEDGRKQLLDWIQRGIELRKKLFKGIFIGNSAVNKQPTERVTPFADNWKNSAQLNKICALTTADFYAAYEANCLGALDVDAFWKAIFECNGIFSFTDFLSDGIPQLCP